MRPPPRPLPALGHRAHHPAGSLGRLPAGRVAGGSCTKGHTGLPVEPRLPPAPLWVGQVTVRLWLQRLCSLPRVPAAAASSRRMQMSL